MGAFFLIHGANRDALAAQLTAGFRAQGFTEGISIERRAWRAVCYPPLASQGGASVVDDGHDVAFCAGTLFYRGLAKTPALARLLADHKQGAIEESALYGSFAAVLVVGATASVLTDRTGTLHVYGAENGTVLSTSFLALAEALPRRHVAERAVYDYVFNGAAFGGATVFDEIRLLSDRHIAVYDDATRVIERPRIRAEQHRYGSVDEAAAHCVALLRDRFGAVPAHWPEIDTALSGGYDSRLTLALARDAGVRARVHVYGRPNDADVRCAQAIAAAEGFPLAHEDKSSVPVPEGDAFAAVAKGNYVAFDGYPTDGIFDNGTDLASRSKRVGGGALLLNGGGGEIFRNFFYLPDRPFSALELAWTFYCQFDPQTCTERFNEEEYVRGVAAQIAERIDADTKGRLTRQEIETVYPLFRCSFWMGRNNSINNRLGYSWTPFIDPVLIAAALAAPLGYKNLGRLEGRMITMVDPSLARHDSVYGRPFDREPSFKESVVGLMGRMRPPRLRRLAYRLRRRTASPWTGALERTRLKTVIDPDLPVMRRYFVLDRIADPVHAERICTLEHLLEQLNHEPA